MRLEGLIKLVLKRILFVVVILYPVSVPLSLLTRPALTVIFMMQTAYKQMEIFNLFNT